MMRTAFSDLSITIEPLVGEGDMIAAQLTHHGTHNGEFMGIAPTGKQVMVTTIGIYRFADNKLEESWILMDQLGMLQQLGAAPPPACPRK